MAVYVDPSAHKFGTMIFCHCWADTLEELLEMVDRIGVQRKWIQGHPTLSFGKHRNASWVHFDISKGKRALAVKAGAIETDRYGPIEWQARRDIASADPVLVEHGTKKLATIADIRKRKET